MDARPEQQDPGATNSNLEVWRKTVFEQRWLHARHVETMRTALLGVYAAILSACLTSFKEGFFKRSAVPLHIFLMALTAVFFLLCIKMGTVFTEHTRAADRMVPKDVPNMLSLFEGHWSQVISVRRLIPTFLALCFLALFGVSVWSLCHN
jgi:hypothetical protein